MSKEKKIYSHSKLSTFENCPLKFKFRYIDKIIPEIESTIESHLGKSVHNTLEWLYLQIKENKIPTIEELIIYYSKDWTKKFSEDIAIIKKELTEKDYFNKGVQFILDYYNKNHPFEDGTLELEKEISLELENGARLRGFIDRLAYNKAKDEFEVHDYKTANNMPSKEQVENDRQLALYSIAIKELFGEDKDVSLIWHYLAHNQKIISRRTNEQLEELKKEIIELINKIENTEEFYPNVSKLCDWCEYKSICPEFNKEENQIKETQQNLDIW